MLELGHITSSLRTPFHALAFLMPVLLFPGPSIVAAALLFEDNFNDGDAAGWSIVDNCPLGPADWSVRANVLMHTYNCFGYSSDGIPLGTYQLSGSAFSNDIDIQVQLLSEDPLLDPVSSNDASNSRYGALGVIFGYQDANNYYRFEMNAQKGYRKLWRVQGGSFTELVTSPQSYTGGQWMDLRIIHQNKVILIFIDGTQVMATEDPSYSSGKIALFCAVNASCSFDNVTVLTAPSSPMPGLKLPDNSVLTARYEAELAARSAAFQIDDIHNGYTGSGYVDYVGEGFVEWTVNVATAGSYDLVFRYALNSGNRPLSILVDGTMMASALDFPATGGWENWDEVRLNATLAAGTNTIRAQTTGMSGANMDHLNLIPQAPLFSQTHASGEYYVTSAGSLDVAGMTTVTTGVGGMEFVLDEGTGGEISQTDLVAPYNSHFNALAAGEHAIAAYLLDSSGARLPASTASATLPQIGTGGIHLYAMGDSITMGLIDDITGDDVSLDTRNTGGGYEPVLNDYLSFYNSVPVTVINDGVSGELTSTGAGRIGAVLAKTPDVQAYLVGYGTNDSGGSMPLASGLGLNTGDSGYAGSYKAYLQQIIDAVVPPPPAGAGKLLFFAKIPPYLKNNTRNSRVQEYNQVIDELIAQLKLDYPSSYLTFTPPDFHGHFTTNQAEMSSDLIHPSGAGYQSMGRLWCQALNGQQGWFCLDDDRDGLLNSVESELGTDPLLADTDGDGLADGTDGFVPLGLIPGGVDTNDDGFVDGEQLFATDPLSTDSDGDRLGDALEVTNSSDPLDPNDWPALADGDIAPFGDPDGKFNAGDIVVAMRITLGLETASPLELAHGDVYPPGAPDGRINLQDLILLQKLP